MTSPREGRCTCPNVDTLVGTCPQHGDRMRLAWQCEGCGYTTSAGDECVGCGERRATAVLNRGHLLRYLRCRAEAYAILRAALEAMPCTNRDGQCDDLDAGGNLEAEDWCLRCAALGNANDILIRLRLFA